MTEICTPTTKVILANLQERVLETLIAGKKQLPLHNKEDHMRWDCVLRAEYEEQWNEQGKTAPALAVFDSVQNALRAAEMMMTTQARDDNDGGGGGDDDDGEKGEKEQLVGVAANISRGRKDSRVLVKEAPATWGEGF